MTMPDMQTLITITALLAIFICLLGAIILAYKGKGEWAWFLFAAFIIGGWVWNK